MNGEHRKEGEIEPGYGVANFVEVAERMQPNDGLLLSRNRARIVGRYGAGYEVALHYEGLNPAPRGERPGVLVNEDFYETAARIKRREKEKIASSAYPMLSVTNYREERTASRMVDIAELLLSERDEVEIYTSASDKADGFEVLTVEVDGLARRLAHTVGVKGEPTVIIGSQMGEPMTEVLPIGAMPFRGHLIDRQTHFRLDEIDRRGETVLGMLQLNIADAFARNVNRTNPANKTDLEVGLYVETFPDLQSRMLDLIDFTDYHGYRLGCGKKDMGNKRWEYEFSLYHDWGEEGLGGDQRPEPLQHLAVHPSLRIAAYRAYLAAKQAFPHAQL